MSLRDELSALDPELLFLKETEYDAAIIGIVETFEPTGPQLRVLYDREQLIAIIAAGMAPFPAPVTEQHFEDAEEHFECNIAGAYVGPHTPSFFQKVERS